MPFIREASDLHLEFNNNFRLPEMPEDKETILILSGDICVIDKLNHALPFFADVTSRFKAVIYVFGNHEYYHGSVTRSMAKFKESVQYDNLHLLQKDFVEIDDIVFIGATLWSDYYKGDPLSMWTCGQGMNDFRLIRFGTAQEPYKRKWSPVQAIALHMDHKKFIEETLEANKEKTCVVVTHHAPSTLSIADEFANDKHNGGYVSDLSDLIFDKKPKLWFHGHMHHSFEYQLFDTRVLCNPKGYATSYREDGSEIYENCDFDPLLRIEL